MTKPVNLFLISRITDESAYQRVERHASGKDESKRTQIHEIISLRQLVDSLLRYGISIEELDGFFLSYQIPQIGKEFDLLKFTESRCLNIEIKSQSVPTEDIHKQLIKNKHYLAHLQKETEFYSVITDSLVTYRLTENNELQQISFSEVVKSVREFANGYLLQIDNMFRASNYLVSPLNTPEKFINGEYFLTQAQEQIKRNILSDIFVLGCCGFYSIIGKPGTGKTLLTYDIAKELSKTQPTLVIHCGKTSDGQQKLKQEIENFNVIAAGYLKYQPDILNGYHYILVDESHRTQNGQLHAKMRKVFPSGCYIGFTGTPLMKKEKNSFTQFGKEIHRYTINQAVEDEAVLPLYYESRLAVQNVTQNSIDKYFDITDQIGTGYELGEYGILDSIEDRIEMLDVIKNIQIKPNDLKDVIKKSKVFKLSNVDDNFFWYMPAFDILAIDFEDINELECIKSYKDFYKKK